MKIDIPNELIELNKQFKKLGVKLYVVGGYVRDFIMGKVSSDIDICSSLTPEEIKESLYGFEVIIFNKKLGSVHIAKNGKVFEHTTFRVDYYQGDGSHSPVKVEFCNDVNTDCYRRDFTINSIYYDIQNDSFVDIFGGINDIENKVIKTIVTPDYVFENDGIRLMRMVRFACQCDFEIDKETLSVAKEYVYKLEDITTKRKTDELVKILEFDNFKKGVKYLSRIGAFKYIFSGINDLPLGKKVDKILFESDFKYIDDFTPRKMMVDLFMIELFYGIQKNIYDKNVTINGLLDYVFSPETIGFTQKRFDKLYSIIMFFEDYKSAENENEKKALLLDNINEIEYILHIAKKEPDYEEIADIYYRLTSKNIALDINDFCIKPADIMALGVKGKNIRTLLNDMFLYSVVYEINDKEILLKVAGQLIKENKYD